MLSLLTLFHHVFILGWSITRLGISAAAQPVILDLLHIDGSEPGRNNLACFDYSLVV
jgi:hypothetical protein